MNKDLVISLDLAKNIKTFGVKQKSLFYYSRDLQILSYRSADIDRYYDYDKHSSAFTAGELAIILPEMIRYDNLDLWLRMTKYPDSYDIAYGFYNECRLTVQHPEFAEALGLMLIQLLEKGYDLEARTFE